MKEEIIEHNLFDKIFEKKFCYSKMLDICRQMEFFTDIDEELIEYLKLYSNFRRNIFVINKERVSFLKNNLQERIFPFYCQNQFWTYVYICENWYLYTDFKDSGVIRFQNTNSIEDSLDGNGCYYGYYVAISSWTKWNDGAYSDDISTFDIPVKVKACVSFIVASMFFDGFLIPPVQKAFHFKIHPYTEKEPRIDAFFRSVLTNKEDNG